MADTNATTTKKTGFFKRIGRFFTEAKAELKKVSWPTKEQLLHNTGVILVFIIIIAVILSVLDLAFTKGFDLLLQLF